MIPVTLEEAVGQRQAAPARVTAAGGKRHAVRCAIIAANALFNHRWILRLVGLINKKLGIIESLFLMYPATEEYALAYVYRNRLQKVKWNPWPCGIAWQNGKFIIKFCISANDSDFYDRNNGANLKIVTEQMESFRHALSVRRVTYAGNLPGILASRRVIQTEPPEAELTAKVVVKAIDTIRETESLSLDFPIIVLGGRGFIGRRVSNLVRGSVRSCVDTSATNSNWPIFLEDQKAIVVNITTRDALSGYINKITPGSIVINEVYPEPDPETLVLLREKGCKVYHISGVKGVAFPSFPAAYQGSIPCCAAWPSDDIEVRVRSLA